ncbi:MAG: hypothetical protein IPO29_18720 [Anaerolineae bacterium]|nr:hypothetical protein [Anaerolineae bacterium]
MPTPGVTVILDRAAVARVGGDGDWRGETTGEAKPCRGRLGLAQGEGIDGRQHKFRRRIGWSERRAGPLSRRGAGGKRGRGKNGQRKPKELVFGDSSTHCARIIAG